MPINKELSAYNAEIAQKPQIIAANKIDAIYGDENEVITKLKQEFEPKGIQVIPISAVSGKNVDTLLQAVSGLL